MKLCRIYCQLVGYRGVCIAERSMHTEVTKDVVIIYDVFYHGFELIMSIFIIDEMMEYLFFPASISNHTDNLQYIVSKWISQRMIMNRCKMIKKENKTKKKKEQQNDKRRLVEASWKIVYPRKEKYFDRTKTLSYREKINIVCETQKAMNIVKKL